MRTGSEERALCGCVGELTVMTDDAESAASPNLRHVSV